MNKNYLNRNFYKSIVIGMSICLPAGIGLGIIQNQMLPGLIAGNILGFVLGIVIHIGNRNKNNG